MIIIANIDSANYLEITFLNSYLNALIGFYINGPNLFYNNWRAKVVIHIPYPTISFMYVNPRRPKVPEIDPCLSVVLRLLELRKEKPHHQRKGRTRLDFEGKHILAIPKRPLSEPMVFPSLVLQFLIIRICILTTSMAVCMYY